MNKRLAAIGTVIVGLLLLIVPIAANLFTVAPAFEDLTDAFRDDVMTEEAVAQARTDIAGLTAVSEEFATNVVPTMAGALEMDTATFAAFVGDQFPAVASGVEALPAIASQFTGVIDLIESQQGNFADADAIPNNSLPVTTVPWAIAGVGVLTLLVGLVMLFRSSLGALLAVVLGVLVVAGTLAFSLIPKSGAADDLNDALKPAYTQDLIDQSQQALGVVGAMGEEMQTAMLPALGQQLGMSQEDVSAFIGENFPTTATALQTMPETMSRFEALVGTFAGQLDNYDTIKSTSLSPIAWMVLFGGVLTTLLGAWGLIAGRREQTAPSDERTAPKTTVKV